jgi:hypothetical protein
MMQFTISYFIHIRLNFLFSFQIINIFNIHKEMTILMMISDMKQ